MAQSVDEIDPVVQAAVNWLTETTVQWARIGHSLLIG